VTIGRVGSRVTGISKREINLRVIVLMPRCHFRVWLLAELLPTWQLRHRVERGKASGRGLARLVFGSWVGYVSALSDACKLESAQKQVLVRALDKAVRRKPLAFAADAAIVSRTLQVDTSKTGKDPRL
jgi:hypothetical protein